MTKLLEPVYLNTVRLTMKNNITGQLQVGWFKSVKEANETMAKIEGDGILGMDYWIQNVPKGQEFVTEWKPESVVPGAVYVQETAHPTVASSSIKFYIAKVDTNGIQIEQKVLVINYIVASQPGNIEISINGINPENDMIDHVEYHSYISKDVWKHYHSQNELEDGLVRFYIGNMSIMYGGPEIFTTTATIHTEHEHDEHNKQEEEKKPEAKGFQVKVVNETEPKKEVVQPVVPQETVEKAKEEEDEPFDYDEKALESDQSVQLPPE